MKRSDLVLHVGFPQTGVEMLQQALGRLQPQLRRHGVGFVGHSALAQLAGVEGWQCKKTTRRKRVRTFERGLAKLVRDEEVAVARHCRDGVRAVIVSSDHLLGCENVTHHEGRLFRPFAEPAVAQAIRALGASRVRLMVYLRRQDRLMELCYLREIEKGRTHEFAEQFPHHVEPVLDYEEVLRRLESLAGVDDVRVRPFELVGATTATYVDDFLSVLELDGRVDLTPVGGDLIPYRLYSRHALNIALDVNAYLDSARERRLVGEFLKELCPGTDEESTRFLPADERARILAAHAPANRRLFEHAMPDLPADAYESEEATARLTAMGRAALDQRSRPVHRGAPQTAVPAAAPHFDDVTFPIDLVYTWVDSEDPDWLASKHAALGQLDEDHHTVDGDDPSRHRSYDELRYSLRSVAAYADFVRHVFIVTDGQVPSWLDLDNDRVTVVDHRDIFADHRCLPTFNSHAIECFLHHIPGLTEHYLYLNDDFAFGRPVTAEQFFHGNGMTKFFLSPALIETGDPSRTVRSVDAAAKNTRRLIYERFGRVVRHKFKHAPYPQRRSILYELEATLHEEFTSTAASPVRGPSDVAVPSSLFHYYAYLTGRAVPGKITSRYVSLDDENLRRRLRDLRRRQQFDVVCINDAVDVRAGDRERRRRALRRFMASRWPTKSPFER